MPCFHPLASGFITSTCPASLVRSSHHLDLYISSIAGPFPATRAAGPDGPARPVPPRPAPARAQNCRVANADRRNPRRRSPLFPGGKLPFVDSQNPGAVHKSHTKRQTSHLAHHPQPKTPWIKIIECVHIRRPCPFASTPHAGPRHLSPHLTQPPNPAPNPRLVPLHASRRCLPSVFTRAIDWPLSTSFSSLSHQGFSQSSAV